jgi:hypothetical protein
VRDWAHNESEECICVEWLVSDQVCESVDKGDKKVQLCSAAHEKGNEERTIRSMFNWGRNQCGVPLGPKYACKTVSNLAYDVDCRSCCRFSCKLSGRQSIVKRFDGHTKARVYTV